jgi:parallel beta-helix repeat protein
MKAFNPIKTLLQCITVAFVWIFIAFAMADGRTVYVNDDNVSGPWDGTMEHPYRYIQDGINSAYSGDTVFVYNGTYYNHQEVIKRIYLLGEDKRNTIIDGGIYYQALTITGTNAAGTEVKGFTVTTRTPGGAAIWMASARLIVSDNLVENSPSDGIFVASQSDSNLIFGNRISDNGSGVYISLGSVGNKTYHNDFINNSPNAYSGWGNVWDDGYPSGGNNWSDYTGTDANADGIGDTPYFIPGTNGDKDRYPLMNALFGVYADANGPYAQFISDSVQFNGLVYGGHPYYSWHWEFDDGDTSNLQNPVHAYQSVGTYLARLTVTDSIGNSDNDTATVTIVERLIADGDGPYQGWKHEPVTLTGNASGGIPPYSWLWRYGDGDSSVQQNPSHIYLAEGVYAATLKVKDSWGFWDIDTTQISINARPTEVWVDDDFDSNTPGWGYDHFNNIQPGIDTVSIWGIVHVNIGTYYECLMINRTINLVGENKESTIIDGQGSCDAIGVTADSISIHGFKVQNQGPSALAGIRIQSDYCNISEMSVTGTGGEGIRLRSAHSIISCCSIEGNGGVGILISKSSYNTISGNNIINNNQSGIRMDTSQNNVIVGNDIENNAQGISLLNSGSNKFYHNNLTNTDNVNGPANNTWDDGYPSGGNYFSDYAGVDDFNGPDQNQPGSDGIGDTPYNIPGGSSKDRYPLMNQWGAPITIYVDDNNTTGPWDGSVEHPYQHIQDGADSARSYDTVFARAGTYNEHVVVNQRVLTLVGQDKDSVVVDGGGTGDAVVLSADWTRMTGFTIQNSGSVGMNAGMNVGANYNSISGNVFQNNSNGVYLASSANNTISDNIVYNNYNGIFIANGFKNIVMANGIANNTSRGIYIDNACDSNQVYHNSFINNFQNAFDESYSTWDKGYPHAGNYWSDFDEPTEGAFDNNLDGIVDSSYAIPGGSNRDGFPLINPWNGTEPTAKCGDVSGNGMVDIGDAVYYLNYLFKNGNPPIPVYCIGDVSDDGLITVSDLIMILHILFKNASPSTIRCCR